MSVVEAEIVNRPVRITRQYTQDERARALAIYDNLGTLEQTSEVTGIAKSTLHGWVNDPDNYSNLRTKTALELAERFDKAANYYLDHAMKKAKDAPFQALMTGAGIAVDKAQLLRNMPTNINLNVDLNGNDLATLLAGSLSNAVLPTDDTD